MSDNAQKKSEVIRKLDADFRQLSRLLFGSEIGGLLEFEDYLKEMMWAYRTSKSCIGGKDVFTGCDFYPKDAKFISQEEIPDLKFGKLDINEIKDVDSLFAAVQEREIYCGNKVFGVNMDAAMVDNATNCSNVYFCHNVYNVKYAAYCSQVRESEHVYGVSPFPKLNHCIRCMEGINTTRAFETYYVSAVADIYYGFNLTSCTNCMFTFNQRGKNFMIGNLQLPRERYMELKAKLAGEIAEMLRKDKRIFSLADVVKMGTKKSGSKSAAMPSAPPKSVEDAFAKTTRIIFDKECVNSRKYAPWMLKRALKVEKVMGAGGKPTFTIDMAVIRDLQGHELYTLEEAFAAAEQKIVISEKEMPALLDIAKRASKVSKISLEFVDGHNENVVDVPCVFNDTDMYHSWDGTNSQYAAYTTAAIVSKFLFGGFLRVLQSEFIINSGDVSDSKACFECDSLHKCSGCYYCHNCENVENGILCFNAKGLHYAVGNVEVGREEFMRIKKMLLENINRQLEQKCEVKETIFGLPKGKRAK